MSHGETTLRGSNVRLLVESLVRQTTILIAELATAGGLRAPLANVAETVFLELARELESHGVSRPVSADMFGMALRTYLRRIRRFDESATQRGTSLWEAVLAFVQGRPVTPRGEVLGRFSADDDVLVKGVLQDLTDSGLIFRSGIGGATLYRPAVVEESGAGRDREALDHLLWALVRREGPFVGAALAERTGLTPEAVEGSLRRLENARRVASTLEDGARSYRAESIVIPLGQGVGWEGAVYDHFHALVKTVICKLRQGASGGRSDDRVGGSTYAFEVWPDHPLADRVYRQLADFRRAASALRAEVDGYNRRHRRPSRYDRVTAYMGQCVIEEEESGGD